MSRSLVNTKLNSKYTAGGTGNTGTPMVGATSSTNGTAGIVPQPVAGDQLKFLRGDATWQSVSGSLGPTNIYTTSNPNIQTVTYNLTVSATVGTGNNIYYTIDGTNFPSIISTSSDIYETWEYTYILNIMISQVSGTFTGLTTPPTVTSRFMQNGSSWNEWHPATNSWYLSGNQTPAATISERFTGIFYDMRLLIEFASNGTMKFKHVVPSYTGGGTFTVTGTALLNIVKVKV